MTTIINTPPPSPAEDSSTGLVIGIIFGALIVILFLFFGVRYYWHGPSNGVPNGTPSQATVVVPSGGTTVNVTAPAATPTSATSK
jgi:hypothetical protein